VKQPCVYIVTNRRNGTLYIGVTANMPRRAFEHREGLVKDFSKKYNCKMLVWYELHESMYEAIAREKPIKAGGRAKKLALIESLNPAWKDLYENADIKSRSPNLSVIASAAKQSRSSGQDWIASSLRSSQ
jgi:predicted GIY-YIG superfamily endonuclease